MAALRKGQSSIEMKELSCLEGEKVIDKNVFLHNGDLITSDGGDEIGKENEYVHLKRKDAKSQSVSDRRQSDQICPSIKKEKEKKL